MTKLECVYNHLNKYYYVEACVVIIVIIIDGLNVRRFKGYKQNESKRAVQGPSLPTKQSKPFDNSITIIYIYHITSI